MKVQTTGMRALGSSRGLQMMPLGGCGEWGANAMVYFWDHRCLLVDAGAATSGPKALGTAKVIPDPFLFKKLKASLTGYVITHGQERHMAALPYFYKVTPAPIYASPWTAEIIRKHFRKAGMIEPEIQILLVGERAHLPSFSLGFLGADHGIPDACHLWIQAGNTRVLHMGTGRYGEHYPSRLPLTESVLKDLAREGVHILVADSQGMDQREEPKAESEIQALERMISQAPKRLWISSAGEEYWKTQAIIAACQAAKKSLIILDHEIKQSFIYAEKLGFSQKSKGNFYFENDTHLKLGPQDVFLVGGSQAEADSHLTRMVQGKFHRWNLEPGDRVIFTSDPDLGREKALVMLWDEIRRQGGEVITTRQEPSIGNCYHLTGQDLEFVAKQLQPRLFVPIGSMYISMLAASHRLLHALPETQVALLETGDVCTYDNEESHVHRKVLLISRLHLDSSAGLPLVHRSAQERWHMGEHGLVNISGVLSLRGERWVQGPHMDLKGLHFTAIGHQQSSFYTEFHRWLCQWVSKQSSSKRSLEETETLLSSEVQRLFQQRFNKRPSVLISLLREERNEPKSNTFHRPPPPRRPRAPRFSSQATPRRPF